MADDITRMAARLTDVLTPTVRAHRWDDCATCDLCGVETAAFMTSGDDSLCPTCMRFARLARERGYGDCRGAFIALEQAMLDGRPGFLLPDRWSPEEIAVLDKAYTVGDVRHRMLWLRLGRSFRAFARSKGGDV